MTNSLRLEVYTSVPTIRTEEIRMQRILIGILAILQTCFLACIGLVLCFFWLLCTLVCARGRSISVLMPVVLFLMELEKLIQLAFAPLRLMWESLLVGGSNEKSFEEHSGD